MLTPVQTWSLRLRHRESLRAFLHQASVSTLRQLCDDATDNAVIENNGVTPDWGCNPWMFNFDVHANADVKCEQSITIYNNRPTLNDSESVSRVAFEIRFYCNCTETV